MTTRTITPDEYQQVCEMLNQLTELLAAAGIVEFKVSKKERLIFWDTEGKGQVSPDHLARLCRRVDDAYTDELERAAGYGGGKRGRL